MPKQERGTRDACVIPYELFADGNYNPAENSFEMVLGGGNKIFREKAVGAPFIVYARNFQRYDFKERNYAVIAGDSLHDEWPVRDFDSNKYQLEVYGPNGFSRQFKGSEDDPHLQVSVKHLPNGSIQIKLDNRYTQDLDITIAENTYGNSTINKRIAAKGSAVVSTDPAKSHGWYDFTIEVKGNDEFKKRYTGRVEAGKPTKSDPPMG